MWIIYEGMFPRARQEQLNRNVENKYNKPLPPSHNGNFGQSKQVFVTKAGFHSDFHHMLQHVTIYYNMLQYVTKNIQYQVK